jgi:hypothetical protein
MRIPDHTRGYADSGEVPVNFVGYMTGQRKSDHFEPENMLEAR